MKRLITIEDLYQLKFISDPQINHQGDFVVFSVKQIDEEHNAYYSNLYIAAVESKEISEFTQGHVNDIHPRWSPNDSDLAFIRTVDRDSQIWTIPSNGGEARVLTKLDEGNIGTFSWSPDGDWIAFEFRPTHPDWTSTARDEREVNGQSNPPRVITRLDYRHEGDGFLDDWTQIWVCKVSTREVTQITSGDFNCREPIWSPDSTQIGFLSNRSNDPINTPFKEDIWVSNVQGAPPRRIPSPNGYKWGLSWSPYGNHIAYIGSETQDDPWCGKNDRLWMVSTQGDICACLTEHIDRICENSTLSDVRGSGNQNPIWSPDGKHIYHLISDTGNTHIYMTDLEGKSSLLLNGKTDICGFTIDSIDKNIAFLASKPTEPSEIFIAQSTKAEKWSIRTQLTTLNSNLLDEIQLRLIDFPDVTVGPGDR